MAEWTRNTQWRQGTLLTDEALRAISLTNPESPDSRVAIVATHNCDLVQLPDKEPQVEVVVGRRIVQLDGNYTHAKSSRTLHIELEGEEPFLAEFVATEKRSFPKDLLKDFEPATESRLSPQNLAIFQQWLAARYRRSAFPDEFERRLTVTKLSNKIEKAVRPHGKMITAVFFDVDEGQDVVRDDSDDIYLLDIILLHATEPDYNAAVNAAEKAKTAIEREFKSKLFDEQTGTWREIELRYVDVISEETLSYRQSIFLKRWRLDHISLGADPPQPMLSE